MSTPDPAAAPEPGATTPPVHPVTAPEAPVTLTKTSAGPTGSDDLDLDPDRSHHPVDPDSPSHDDAVRPADPYGTPVGPDPYPPPVQQVEILEPQGPALGTLVWGCVALAVAALLGAWEVLAVRVDLATAVPVAMVALGLLLVVGAVVTAVRQRR